MKETFKDYGDYMISDHGRVFSKKSNRFLKLSLDNKRRAQFTQWEDKKSHTRKIKVLVYELFGDLPEDYYDNKENYFIYKIDRDPFNNKISNLRIIKKSEYFLKKH